MDLIVHRDDVFSDIAAATLWVTGEFTVSGSVDVTVQPHKSIFAIIEQLKEAAESGRLKVARKEQVTTVIDNHPIQSVQYYFTARDLLDFAKSRGIVPEFLRPIETEAGEATQAQKPLTATERNTLLTIIAALCDHSAIDIAGRGTANAIAEITEEFGAPVSDDTIRNVLKKIPEALASRKK